MPWRNNHALNFNYPLIVLPHQFYSYCSTTPWLNKFSTGIFFKYTLTEKLCRCRPGFCFVEYTPTAYLCQYRLNFFKHTPTEKRDGIYLNSALSVVFLSVISVFPVLSQKMLVKKLTAHFFVTSEGFGKIRHFRHLFKHNGVCKCRIRRFAPDKRTMRADKDSRHRRRILSGKGFDNNLSGIFFVLWSYFLRGSSLSYRALNRKNNRRALFRMPVFPALPEQKQSQTPNGYG